MKTFVLFYRPNTVPPAWVNTDTYYSASRIPGVTVLIDTGGSEARRFRAYTSGQAFLYRCDGSLAYSGGITAGRGHEGDSDGQKSIENTVLLGSGGFSRSPVFGCSVIPESYVKRL